jgi:hypothetical protein
MKMKWDLSMLHNRAVLNDRLIPETATMRIVRTLGNMDAVILETHFHHGRIGLVVEDKETGFLWDLQFSQAGFCIPKIMHK